MVGRLGGGRGGAGAVVLLARVQQDTRMATFEVFAKRDDTGRLLLVFLGPNLQGGDASRLFAEGRTGRLLLTQIAGRLVLRFLGADV